MKKIYLTAVSFLFVVSTPGLLLAAEAEMTSADEIKPVVEKNTKKSVSPIKITKKSSPGMGGSFDAFNVDLRDDNFYTLGELKMGVEKWYGDNTYQIGYPVYDYGSLTYVDGYFPFSELEFPLDVVMFSAQYDLEIKKRWMISLGFKTDLDHSGDDMEDSDWITASSPDRLDIFSTSNITDFEAYEYDLNFKFKYLMGSNWSLDAGVGYLFQKYKYESAIKAQYSPSGLVGWDYSGDGRTPSIKYDVFYQIPYLQMGGAVSLGKRFKIIASASYSPFVHAEDEDQHLLRGKVNRGNLDGDSWMGNVDARYFINRNWFVSLEYSYKHIEVDGQMEALFYGVADPDHWVWEELESEQHAGSLMIGYHY